MNLEELVKATLESYRRYAAQVQSNHTLEVLPGNYLLQDADSLIEAARVQVWEDAQGVLTAVLDAFAGEFTETLKDRSESFTDALVSEHINRMVYQMSQLRMEADRLKLEYEWRIRTMEDQGANANNARISSRESMLHQQSQGAFLDASGRRWKGEQMIEVNARGLFYRIWNETTLLLAFAAGEDTVLSKDPRHVDRQLKIEYQLASQEYLANPNSQAQFWRLISQG